MQFIGFVVVCLFVSKLILKATEKTKPEDYWKRRERAQHRFEKSPVDWKHEVACEPQQVTLVVDHETDKCPACGRLPLEHDGCDVFYYTVIGWVPNHDYEFED